MDRSSKQNIKKGTVALNNALDEMDLTDTYRAFHPKEAKCTSFQVYIEHFQHRPHDRTQSKPQQIQEH